MKLTVEMLKAMLNCATERLAGGQEDWSDARWDALDNAATWICHELEKREQRKA